MTIVAVRVTRRGVLVSRELIAALGNVQEVQIESRPDAVVITRKPRTVMPGALKFSTR